MLSCAGHISDPLGTKAPEAHQCTRGITSVSIQSTYSNGNARAVLHVKHILTLRVATVSDCPVLAVQKTKAT